MCQFFSAIITKNKILYDLDIDSHEELITKFKLKDDTTEPNFVRVETTPIDGNVFNLLPSNWKTKVDQDYLPKWFDIKEVEISLKSILKKVLKARVIILGEIDTLDKGRWFIGGSAQVSEIYGSAQVSYIGGSAQVSNIYGSAQVSNIYGSAKVSYISDSAQVSYIGGSAQVSNIYGSAKVSEISDSANMEVSTVKDLITIIKDKAIIVCRNENKILTKGWDK